MAVIGATVWRNLREGGFAEMCQECRRSDVVRGRFALGVVAVSHTGPSSARELARAMPH